MGEFASEGVAGAGLGLDIAGTALGVLNGGWGNLLGGYGRNYGGCGYGGYGYGAYGDVGISEALAERDAEIARLSANTADLFMSLCDEEVEHAEKLLKEGQRLLTDMPSDITRYLDEEAKEPIVHDKCKAIWEWETRLAMERVLELKYKLSQYRNMR